MWTAALTTREQAVLELVAQGKDNSEITRALSLSEKTVRNYVSTIISKFQVARRSQAIVGAPEAGYGLDARRSAR